MTKKIIQITILTLLGGGIFLAGLEAKSANLFLRSGVGAKAPAFGNNYGAIVKDPSSLYWNPAGLANISGKRKEIKSLNTGKQIEDEFDNDQPHDADIEGENKNNSKEVEVFQKSDSFEVQVNAAASVLAFDREVGFAGAAFTLFGGSFGLGLLANQVGGIDGYDDTGAATSTLNYRAFAGYLGYGFQQGATRIGFSLAGTQEQFGSESLWGGGLNFGIQSAPFPFMAIGLDIQNLAGVVQKSIEQTSSYEKLDMILRFSVALFSIPPNADLMVIFGFSSNLDDLNSEEGFEARLGFGYRIIGNVYAMAGMNGSVFSLGVGIAENYFQIFYSVNQNPLDRSIQHNAEINLSF